MRLDMGKKKRNRKKYSKANYKKENNKRINTNKVEKNKEVEDIEKLETNNAPKTNDEKVINENNETSQKIDSVKTGLLVAERTEEKNEEIVKKENNSEEISKNIEIKEKNETKINNEIEEKIRTDDENQEREKEEKSNNQENDKQWKLVETSNSKLKEKEIKKENKKQNKKNKAKTEELNNKNQTEKSISKKQKDRAQKKELKEQKKQQKAQRKKEKKKHKILRFFLKFFLIIIILSILLLIAGIWGFAGILLGWFGDNIDISEEDLRIKVSNSVIVDKNGEVLADLSGDEKRKIITLDEMADYLPKAYIAIEDERFYEHNGVDLKRTAGAIINVLLDGESDYGGSTITQQLVKNITNDNESLGIEGIKRKIREWSRACQVERMISKEQILELYLNILFVGANNLHGVELGAEYYFNKSAKDLSLAECAFMAGINYSPNSYNPYSTTEDNTEKIKNRTITVLNKMKELGYITNEEEYNSAITEVQNGLKFGTGQIIGGSIFSYHTDAVISQVIEQVMQEKNMTEQMAKNYIYSSGLTIHSTVDKNIQNRLEEEYKQSKYVISGRKRKSDGTLLNEHSQSGMAIVDYKTGNVVAIAGGFGEKTSSGWNRATQMEKQTGSSIKPLAVVAPGLQEKIITAATVYNDSRTRFGKNYEPVNYNGFKGPINIRSFIRTSQNIPAVKIMVELTPAKSLEYLQKMGITSLNPQTDNVLSLALGGMTSGVSPLEMASAYGTIANDGVYVTPTFYTSVTDSDGNVVLEPKQESRQVISAQNAYIAKTIIQEPVKSGGTATYCAIPGMDVAAKTGTTDNSYDRWLCGFTPYYAAATWYGYDNSETVYYNGNPAGQIWDAVMTDIHKDLPGATFVRPEGIVERTVCRTTGCLATRRCTNTYTEIFTQDNIPEECTSHSRIPKETLGLWTSLSSRSN